MILQCGVVCFIKNLRNFNFFQGFPRATTAPIATQTPPLQQRRTFMNYESSVNRQQVPDQSPRMMVYLFFYLKIWGFRGLCP